MGSAQSWARTQLTYKFPEDYRDFYLQEKDGLSDSATNSRAQGRAKTLLVHKYWTVYKDLFEQAVKLGYRRSNSPRRGEVHEQ
jgi:hypothetical protein